MDEQFDKKRIDLFQRVLIAFFFTETLSGKERKMVIWIVRLVTVAGALIFSMLITLVTESILSFFWFIIVFVTWYVILQITGMLRRRRHINKEKS